MALHCHECGFVNAEGANYCQKCGAYLGRQEGAEEPSTLTYKIAETGDFEKAKEWSQKAIDNGREGEVDQLKPELESYKQNKPWREVQETEEKSATAEAEKKPKKAPARTADF